MSMCITIDRIDQKPKLSVVRTSNGRQLKCWTDKLEKFGLETGGTYNVETDEKEFGDNTVTMIISAKRMSSAPPASPSSATSTSHQNGGSSAPAAAAPFRSPEQMFVEGVIVAYIGNGRCDPGKLRETIGYIRDAWNAHWGAGREAFSQAAE